jgi:hypothetical protein
LKEFKEDGLLVTDKTDIIIKDPEGLARIGHLYD